MRNLILGLNLCFVTLCFAPAPESSDASSGSSPFIPSVDIDLSTFVPIHSPNPFIEGEHLPVASDQGTSVNPELDTMAFSSGRISALGLYAAEFLSDDEKPIPDSIEIEVFLNEEKRFESFPDLSERMDESIALRMHDGEKALPVNDGNDIFLTRSGEFLRHHLKQDTFHGFAGIKNHTNEDVKFDSFKHFSWYIALAAPCNVGKCLFFLLDTHSKVMANVWVLSSSLKQYHDKAIESKIAFCVHYVRFLPEKRQNFGHSMIEFDSMQVTKDNEQVVNIDHMRDIIKDCASKLKEFRSEPLPNTQPSS